MQADPFVIAVNFNSRYKTYAGLPGARDSLLRAFYGIMIGKREDLRPAGKASAYNIGYFQFSVIAVSGMNV